MRIGEETFVAKGTILRARNFLEVFPYDRIAESVLPAFSLGETVRVAALCVEEGATRVAPRAE